MGQTTIVKHHIPTPGGRPFKYQPHRIPHHLKPVMENQIDEMLQNNIISPSASPWSSPIVLVKKKDGSHRFCVDYRGLNAITTKDAYPIPRVDETLDSLGGATYFSTLDLASGYWQVEVREEDKEKTAFTSPQGHFEFQVMPFGLCNAPATFQRLMEYVLAGLQWEHCLIYLDDIIVFSSTFEEHIEKLTKVFQRLREGGLKLKPKKCFFAKSSVKYLGHIVSQRGLEPDPEKIKAVTEYPRPQSASALCSFLGLAGYYRRFISGFSSVAAPLFQLQQQSQNKPLVWTEDGHYSFCTLQQKLVSAPILAFPQFEVEFILATDASDTGLGVASSPDSRESGSVRFPYDIFSLP